MAGPIEDIAARLGTNTVSPVGALGQAGTYVNTISTNAPDMVTPLPGTNALVMPPMEPGIEPVEGGLICVRFNAKARHIYFIESSTNLSNWSRGTPDFPAAGRVGWQFKATNAAMFFRVQEGWWNGAAIVFAPVAVLTNPP